MGLIFNVNKSYDRERLNRKVDKVIKSSHAREKKEHGRFGDIIREEAAKLKKQEEILRREW